MGTAWLDGAGTGESPLAAVGIEQLAQKPVSEQGKPKGDVPADGNGETATPPDKSQQDGSTEPSANTGALCVPEGLVDMKDHDTALTLVSELDAMALPVAKGELQALAVAVMEEMQTPAERALDLSDQSQCEQEIRNRWGGDFKANHAVVYQTAQSLGPAFCDWLDRTGLGNSPVVLSALLEYGRGTTKLTPEAAQAEITRIMADPTYRKAGANRVLVSRSRLLSRLAYGSR